MSNEFLTALTIVLGKVSRPSFVMLAVFGLFTLSFEDVTSWNALAYLVCLGCALTLIAILHKTLSAWLDGKLSSETKSGTRSRAAGVAAAKRASASSKQRSRRRQGECTKRRGHVHQDGRGDA